MPAIPFSDCPPIRHQIDDARIILVAALKDFREGATVHFNLACYEAQIGNLDLAWNFLKAAVKLDPDFIAASNSDPDLAPLRGKGTIR